MALNDIALSLHKVQALVVGDRITDTYSFGRVERISPEAPVPVFVEERTETRDGGAANVVHQLSVLGCGVVPAMPFLGSHKLRYMVGHHQILRVDDDHIATPCEQEIAAIAKRVEHCNLVILSDYAKGCLCDAMCRAVIERARYYDIPVIVDPKGQQWEKYYDATVICPNQREYRDAGRIPCVKFPTVLVKQGEAGMTLLRVDREPVKIAAHARHVYDVTGAGDTVVAVLAAAIAVGAPIEEAANLASIAAGYVVGEVGTSVCSRRKLLELIATQGE